MGSSVTLAEGAQSFLATLAAGEKQAYSQEIQRFVRWYGPAKSFADLGSQDVELYVGELEAATSDSSVRAEALRALLTYAKHQGWTATNMAVMVRIRKRPGRRDKAGERKAAKVIHLTPEGHRKIKTELEGLVQERPKIAEELRTARADKDFRENAPLDAARQRQAQVEGRIQELQATLKAAQIIQDENVSGTKAGLGSKVVLRDLGYDEEMTYTLVSPNEVDLRKGKISVVSPTGKALLDKEPGDEVEVIAPAGTVRYRVERVEK